MQRTEASSILRQSSQASSLLVCAAAALLLLGCNGFGRGEAERQRAAEAERQRQLDALVSRCRRQQPAVKQQLQSLNGSNAALNQLNQQGYAPLPQPPAPDPALLARFTRDDQELELERHVKALARWRQQDGAERRRWDLEQERRRQQLAAQQLLARTALNKLGVASTPEAQTAWSSCDRAQLGALAQR
ncbi:hypothetical protein KBY57_05245 [Cyanobium sp. Aljojuca 7D2]|uniref:hypothetical protein n=1 Tax=Cyanobium sp. Aljojuca 7D2 TaxID=2823698 RepID=UPI0020CBF32E|nr:hypothetical protein [Cyanobium sp. Aljojuca 7D2]MCP9890462.1 hypothetical protein [Cyanobium sp. Aljojuca 7D2]